MRLLLGDYVVVFPELTASPVEGIVTYVNITSMNFAVDDNHQTLFNADIHNVHVLYHRFWETYIHRAVRMGDVKTVLECMTGPQKMDYMNATDVNGQTPLHIAARFCQVEIMKLLIDSGCDVNIQSLSGNTPLLVSLKRKFLEGIHLLLGTPESIDVARVDSFGRSAADWAFDAATRRTFMIQVPSDVVTFCDSHAVHENETMYIKHDDGRIYRVRLTETTAIVSTKLEPELLVELLRTKDDFGCSVATCPRTGELHSLSVCPLAPASCTVNDAVNVQSKWLSSVRAPNKVICHHKICAWKNGWGYKVQSSSPMPSTSCVVRIPLNMTIDSPVFHKSLPGLLKTVRVHFDYFLPGISVDEHGNVMYSELVHDEDVCLRDDAYVEGITLRWRDVAVVVNYYSATITPSQSAIVSNQLLLQKLQGVETGGPGLKYYLRMMVGTIENPAAPSHLAIIFGEDELAQDVVTLSAALKREMYKVVFVNHTDLSVSVLVQLLHGIYLNALCGNVLSFVFHYIGQGTTVVSTGIERSRLPCTESHPVRAVLLNSKQQYLELNHLWRYFSLITNHVSFVRIFLDVDFGYAPPVLMDYASLYSECSVASAWFCKGVQLPSTTDLPGWYNAIPKVAVFLLSQHIPIGTLTKNASKALRAESSLQKFIEEVGGVETVSIITKESLEGGVLSTPFGDLFESSYCFKHNGEDTIEAGYLMNVSQNQRFEIVGSDGTVAGVVQVVSVDAHSARVSWLSQTRFLTTVNSYYARAYFDHSSEQTSNVVAVSEECDTLQVFEFESDEEMESMVDFSEEGVASPRNMDSNHTALGVKTCAGIGTNIGMINALVPVHLGANEPQTINVITPSLAQHVKADTIAAIKAELQQRNLPEHISSRIVTDFLRKTFEFRGPEQRVGHVTRPMRKYGPRRDTHLDFGVLETIPIDCSTEVQAQSQFETWMRRFYESLWAVTKDEEIHRDYALTYPSEKLFETAESQLSREVPVLHQILDQLWWKRIVHQEDQRRFFDLCKAVSRLHLLESLQRRESTVMWKFVVHTVATTPPLLTRILSMRYSVILKDGLSAVFISLGRVMVQHLFEADGCMRLSVLNAAASLKACARCLLFYAEDKNVLGNMCSSLLRLVQNQSADLAVVWESFKAHMKMPRNVLPAEVTRCLNEVALSKEITWYFDISIDGGVVSSVDTLHRLHFVITNFQDFMKTSPLLVGKVSSSVPGSKRVSFDTPIPYRLRAIGEENCSNVVQNNYGQFSIKIAGKLVDDLIVEEGGDRARVREEVKEGTTVEVLWTANPEYNLVPHYAWVQHVSNHTITEKRTIVPPSNDDKENSNATYPVVLWCNGGVVKPSSEYVRVWVNRFGEEKEVVEEHRFRSGKEGNGSTLEDCQRFIVSWNTI
eukprot:PhF_6_TR25444/c0_g1_i3/m.35173